LLSRAERTASILSAATSTPAQDLHAAWEAVLLNSFHDILPGSSIERAFDDQLAQLGGALHAGQRAELMALNVLASRVDTTVPAAEGDHPTATAFLVWNPHPHVYRGHVELEAALDYRPIFAYQNRVADLPLEVRGPDGEHVPFQVIETEHNFMAQVPWRSRVLVPIELPPLGWSVFQLGWREGASSHASPLPAAVAPRDGIIENGQYSVTARPGDRGIQISRNGQPVFSGAGLAAITVEDPWGSWGGMSEEPESLDLSQVRAEWTVQQVETLERGPERAVLWVRLTGGDSRLDLTFTLYRDRDAVDVAARVFWNERSARLKLVLPCGEQAEFDVPGGSVQRGPNGEVPGGRWVRVDGSHGSLGFASDALYNFDCKDGCLRATVVRATRYATDAVMSADDEPWRPAVDGGELRFRFVLAAGDDNLPRLARELEEPPLAQIVAASPGVLPRSGSLASLAPESLHLLALKPAEDGNGWILRVRETAGLLVQPQLNWLGEPLALKSVPPHTIASWRIYRGELGNWAAEATNITELPDEAGE
jgi:alpha-mannosidase